MSNQARIHALRCLARVGMALAAIAVLLVHSPLDAAAEPGKTVTVIADQAKLVALAGEPNMVVIGNPLYAEVSIKQGMIVIHGRQFGTTNVLVLDRDANELANFELTVVRGGAQNLTVYKGGSPFSYVCAPACETTPHVGDNTEYYNAVNNSVQQKLQMSTGASGMSN